MNADEIIKELEKLQPKKVDYAELVGSPAPSSYGCCYVWEDPEPYIIQNGIDIIKQQQSDLATAHTRTSELEMELKAYKKHGLEPCDYAGIVASDNRTKKAKEDLSELMKEYVRLKAHDKEAMELLEASALDIKKWKICAVCSEFQRNKCKRGFVRASSNYAGCRCWKWIHTNYHEALKANR